ncbi:hypothetical protein JTB14_036940 [Gonioctena quinquepunctata]|nr:hypothetical protein JTB14_036940 [Gonioctena quinquepunctata]
MDSAGFLHIKMNRCRGPKAMEVYIYIFLCFATNAFDIELASDLFSDIFPAALKCFIARGVRYDRLISDCGTDFKGAHKQLAESMEDAASEEFISWSFHAPGSPHFGGIWKRGVKSIETHLVRVVGQ